MKKIVLIILALITALMVSELVVRYVINFPDLGIRKIFHIYPNDKTPYGATNYLKIYRPYAGYFNKEDGYAKLSFNNIGIMGPDILGHQECIDSWDEYLKTGKRPPSGQDSSFIYLAGNSFIASRAMQQNKSVAFFLDSLLKSGDRNINVVNAAVGGGLPGSCSQTIDFMQPFFPAKYVVLIYNDYMVGNLQNVDDILDHGTDFGQPLTSVKTMLPVRLSSCSAMLNLLRVGIKYDKSADKTFEGKRNEQTSFKTEKLIKSLDLYRLKYGKKFVLINMGQDEAVKRVIEQYAENNNVWYIADGSIMDNPNNRLASGVHFNAQGNRLTAELVYRLLSQLP